MAVFINTIYFGVWLVQAIRQIMMWSYWLQVKEYRLDRFRVFLKSKTGRKQLDVLNITAKLFGFFLLSLLPLDKFTFLAMLLSCYLVFIDIKFASEYFKKDLRRPKFTLRIKEVLAFSIIGIFIYFALVQFPSGNCFLKYFCAEILLLTFPIIGICLTKSLVDRTKRREIEKAQEKVKRLKPIVIGITGSYGKTTTKYFIHQLLSEDKKVSKTPGSHNTEFGLARSIIGDIQRGDEYFVAEYGAYKKGEINKLKKIVSPKIAVLTAVEPQHLELFGSLENILSAKYELFQDLKNGDIAIFNIGNNNAAKLYKKAKEQLKRVEILTYASVGFGRADIVLKKWEKVKDLYEFTIKLGSKEKKIKTNLHLTYLFENLLPAILIARRVGVSWKSIKTACKKLNLPERTMDIKKVSDKLTIIDDTHNLSPASFLASINFLSGFNTVRKIVITPGMIELGKQSRKCHRGIAKKMKKVEIDELILTNNDQVKVFREILGDKVKMPGSINLKEIADRNAGKVAILLAGRVPAKTRKELGLL